MYAVCSSDGWASSTAHAPTVFRPLISCKGTEAMNVLPATTVGAFERALKLRGRYDLSLAAYRRMFAAITLGRCRISDRHDTRGQFWHKWDDCQLSGIFRRKFTSELRLLVLLLVNRKDTIGVLCETWRSMLMWSYKIDFEMCHPNCVYKLISWYAVKNTTMYMLIDVIFW